MPCIRSPPQRRSSTWSSTTNAAQAPVHVASLDENDDIDAEQENDPRESNRRPIAQPVGTKVISTAQPRRNSFSGASRHRSPTITVLPDNTTRIWELEGEVSRLEREKRFLEESRQTQAEEYEQRLSELKKDLMGQLEAERKKHQRELETTNSKWRAELDEANARHEKAIREHEKKLAQMCEAVKLETSSELGPKLEAAERENEKLKNKVELLSLEIKEKESLQKRIEFLENELRQSREQASSTLLQVREQAEKSMEELKQTHARELESRLTALRVQLQQEFDQQLVQDLEMAQIQADKKHSEQLASALETLKHDLEMQYSRDLQTAVEAARAEMKAHYDREMKLLEMRAAEERAKAVDPAEVRHLRENLKYLQAQNDSLRAALHREQEEHAHNIRQKVIEMELAQQRNDEAVARALSIVKQTEAKIAQAVYPGSWSRTMPASIASVPSAPSRVVRGRAASPGLQSHRAMRAMSAASVGTPRYLSPTQSSLAREESILSQSSSRW